ncbi:PH-interacting protein isoform X2 [Plodia interpunctella]|uniref:PH-interacting protein isoform X2 n=1 Tax=Plodia interpunctella TaxID=58824 RepID=UPI0023678346|nr:PH-interacting protein isoform X2 [Plodia interpunctella]
MEESNEEHRVVPELYFLIAKFLSGGPLKETAKTLLKELESVEVLPRRLDWEGNEHSQSYDELASKFSDVSCTRLPSVCERALRLARYGPSAGPATSAPADGCGATGAIPTAAEIRQLTARLSLLSESLVRPKPKYASYKPDHTVVRRIAARELGTGPASLPGSPGRTVFPYRMLSGLTLQRRTLGHLSAVYCLLCDRTGRYVITGADDLLVKVWSAIDGRLLTTLRGAGAEITDVCASADGALLACGSVERLVRVWCLETGAPRAVLSAHAGTITSVHWAPPAHKDLRWLASTSTDGSVAFWTCSPQGQFLSQPVQYVERMRPGACHMICAAWSSGGMFLACGSADQHVRVYSVQRDSGGPRRVLEVAVHSDAVDSIAWAHSGLRFVSGSKDGSACVWTLHATQWRHTQLLPQAEQGKRLKVTMVCWDNSDAYILTAVSDLTIRVWTAAGAQLHQLKHHTDEAYVLEAHPFLPSVFLSAGHDGQLFVWHAESGELLAKYHNKIEGQGSGAIFDAKWAGGHKVAASDSHGHLLILGLGAGHKLLKVLPTELFFHTDYRPLARDALGGALDEQTETPPHLMPPPFLVDVEGAPHPPELQRLVPGRENLALSQLIPAWDAARSRLDAMILALAGDGSPPVDRPIGGVWRGEGVRHTAGSWQRGDPLLVPHSSRPVVAPLSAAHRLHIERTANDRYLSEEAWWKREMRRRPVMISTQQAGEPTGPRRRAGRRPGVTAPPPRPRPRPAPASDTDSDSDSDHRTHSSVALSDMSSSQSGSKTDNSSSSQYSDWEAGAALAPPARARRKPQAKHRYSPSPPATKKRNAALSASLQNDSDDNGDGDGDSPPRDRNPSESAHAVEELAEVYRPGEWITAVLPRKAPYHPQMGDECLYFRLGHQRYFEAVAEKDLYKINPRDKPWERTVVNDCELVKVVGMKYVIKPPRIVCLKLACAGSNQHRARSFTVRYHDMPDVIDFLVLKQQYSAAIARKWSAGDRFRCVIDDSWWTGSVLERSSAPPPAHADCAPEHAARQFLALRVRWDNGEVERLSPWDLEPLDEARLPRSPGGAVPVLAAELRALLYRPAPAEWPPGADQRAASAAIAGHVSQVMTLAVAEPFVAPVDLARYPSYAKIVPYPVDLATIRSRCENLFYRRIAALQFDVRYLATNAETYNDPHAPIVRSARLVTDLLLYIIAHWQNVDVLAKYRELCAGYQSTDDEKLNGKISRGVHSRASWMSFCESVLRELCASADSEPFLQPVNSDLVPDYRSVISEPMDLGTVRSRLSSGRYSAPSQVARDIRRVFSNSRLYNTNKRSRIYSMTVRLSALFEALWANKPETSGGRQRRKRVPRKTYTDEFSPSPESARPVRTRDSSSSSSSEPLLCASRRALAARAALTRDTDDSDAPLYTQTKGKGVGKKSKSGSGSTEPVAGSSRARSHLSYESSIEHANGQACSDSSSDSAPQMEEEMSSDHSSYREVELDYDRKRERRKRRHTTTTAESALSADSDQNDNRHHSKRRRSRTRASFSESATSSSGDNLPLSAADGRRYESDHSYKPRYSSEDDAPLQLIRQRQQNARASTSGAGPSGRRRKPAVSLRRQSPRRYNEDSEDDSIAVISKRSQHHRLSAAAPPHNTDHDYINGHNGTAASGSGTAPVSISSRGRVRKLTAKARGLLRE